MKKGFGNNETQKHDIGYEFRRKRRREKILIVVIILILIAFVMIRDVGGIRTLIWDKIYSFNFSALKSDLILLEGENMIYPCSFINISSKISTCEYRCGLENMEYAKYKCAGNAVNCYCKK
jgi:hypothetical protein